MPEFNTTLLREKFIINDMMPTQDAGAGSVVALSNRLIVPLQSETGDYSEVLVVRAQNMHSCARMAAFIARKFQEDGPITSRLEQFDWEEGVEIITKGYEYTWNPKRWIAVYHKGRMVFEDGEVERHPFLDIIEQCDARNKGDYEKAMEVAQDAFNQAGKAVSIDYDSNVALVVNITPAEGKCGLILRAPNKTTTFNMTAKPKLGKPVTVSNCLTAAAAFLEGVQLAFFVGLTRQKLRYELIGPASKEARQCEDASNKLGRLNVALSQFEGMFQVTYRPERPSFSDLITDAESFARKALSTEIEKMIRSGAEDADEWVL